VSTPAGPVPTPTPGIGNQGPPAWIQPGTRITFYAAAASVAQSRFAWIEDPDGDWQDPKTGRHYRRTDESGEGQGTASGDGLTQIDVLAVEGRDVVLSSALYGIDRVNNQFVVVPGSGAKVPGASVDGAWIHPDVLAGLQNADLGGLLVLRGPYRLGDVTYQAVSFVNPTPGAYQSYTYDTATGLLVAATTSTAGPTSPVTAFNEPPPQGNTQLTITRLAGVRQRSIPGLNGTNPEWVARTAGLSYAGTYNFTNPVDPSSANFSYPMRLDIALGPGGRSWSAYTSRTEIQIPGGQPSQGSGVTGTTGVYWVDPRALAGLREGALLDRDPLTNERDTVVSVDAGPNGGTLTVAAQLPGLETVATYDATTGVLVQYRLHEASGGITIRLDLQRMP
jgi:hypothetical protein